MKKIRPVCQIIWSTSFSCKNRIQEKLKQVKFTGRTYPANNIFPYWKCLHARPENALCPQKTQICRSSSRKTFIFYRFPSDSAHNLLFTRHVPRTAQTGFHNSSAACKSRLQIHFYSVFHVSNAYRREASALDVICFKPDYEWRQPSPPRSPVDVQVIAPLTTCLP